MDNVSSLLHLPIVGRFQIASIISLSLSCLTAEQDLGVSEEVVLKEFDFNRGSHIRMSWLQGCLGIGIGTRSLLRHIGMRLLLECPCYIWSRVLFLQTSRVFISMPDTWFSSSLDVTSLAQGCVVLTILYTTLGVATIFETKQLAGYLSLLHVYLKLLFIIYFLFICYE